MTDFVKNGSPLRVRSSEGRSPKELAQIDSVRLGGINIGKEIFVASAVEND